LVTDEDRRVRESAVLALNEVGPFAKKAVPALLRALTDHELCGIACRALKSIKVKATILIPVLTKVLESADGKARWEAAYELGELSYRGVNALPALLRVLRDDDVTVRRGVVIALGKIRAEENVPALIEAVQDADVTVRSEAIHSLALFKSRASQAIPSLVKALHEKSLGEDAASAIGEIGRERGDGVPALIGVLKEGDRRALVCAIKALDAIGPKARDAIAVLAAALEDADREVSFAAKCALNGISPGDYPLDTEDLHRLFDHDQAWKTEKPACPRCGSLRMGRIFYGTFDLSALELLTESGNMVWGGCCVSDDSPRWFCKDCEANW
jgi:HEAT repeat protein